MSICDVVPQAVVVREESRHLTSSASLPVLLNSFPQLFSARFLLVSRHQMSAKVDETVPLPVLGGVEGGPLDDKDDRSTTKDEEAATPAQPVVEKPKDSDFVDGG